jgi:hypothetical protein
MGHISQFVLQETLLEKYLLKPSNSFVEKEIKRIRNKGVMVLLIIGWKDHLNNDEILSGKNKIK